MFVMITKTNSDYEHTFKNFTTIETLFNYVKSCGHAVVLQENDWHSDSIDVIMDCWRTSKEDAEKIKQAEWEMEIYNSWRE